MRPGGSPLASRQLRNRDRAVAGSAQAEHLVRLLAGFNVHAWPISGDKVVRFSPFSAQAEQGNVVVLRGPWNEDWFAALESFPPPTNTGHDDDADSTAEAFNALAGDNLATWAKRASLPPDLSASVFYHGGDDA